MSPLRQSVSAADPDPLSKAFAFDYPVRFIRILADLICVLRPFSLSMIVLCLFYLFRADDVHQRHLGVHSIPITWPHGMLLLILFIRFGFVFRDYRNSCLLW